jgi:hypothetical protein
VVVAPGCYRDMLKVMRRAYRGAAENRMAVGPVAGTDPRIAQPTSTTPSTLRDVLRLCHSLSGVFDAATYTFVAITARIYIAAGRSARWERDESSRSAGSVT